MKGACVTSRSCPCVASSYALAVIIIIMKGRSLQYLASRRGRALPSAPPPKKTFVGVKGDFRTKRGPLVCLPEPTWMDGSFKEKSYSPFQPLPSVSHLLACLIDSRPRCRASEAHSSGGVDI